MSGHTYTHTHIHTHIHTYTHDNYYNPRCAHAHRGLTTFLGMLSKSMGQMLRISVAMHVLFRIDMRMFHCPVQYQMKALKCKPSA